MYWHDKAPSTLLCGIIDGNNKGDLKSCTQSV